MYTHTKAEMRRLYIHVSRQETLRRKKVPILCMNGICIYSRMSSRARSLENEKDEAADGPSTAGAGAVPSKR